jgi:nitrate/nitrite transporter NarK
VAGCTHWAHFLLDVLGEVGRTNYSIVPFFNEKLIPVVSALVGACGNLGAVVAGFGLPADFSEK